MSSEIVKIDIRDCQNPSKVMSKLLFGNVKIFVSDCKTGR